jgi:hypothetical protein
LAANLNRSIVLAFPLCSGRLVQGGQLSRGQKLFEAMGRNPKADWRIADVETVCRHFGVTCKAPSGGGSHYTMSHPIVFEILTIPAKRPIKPIYIKQLVAYIFRTMGPANDA